MSLLVFDRSVLENANPRGRVDVLVSNLVAHAASVRGYGPQFDAVRPVLDLGLLYLLGPELEFKRAVRGIAAGPRAARPKRAGARTKRARKPRVLIPEVVSL